MRPVFGEVTYEPLWVDDDGGRAAAGFVGDTGDCVVRAISIATAKPYREVYDAINMLDLNERLRNFPTMARLAGKGWHPARSRSENGVHTQTSQVYMTSLGWQWVPTLLVGGKKRVRLRPVDLPNGRLVVSMYRHFVAVIDGVVHDTWDSSNNGTACVYGYYYRPEEG